MTRLPHSNADPGMEGEQQPPAHVAIASVDEMSPAQFLALHGIRAPQPKAYRTFDEAMAVIITDVTEGVA